MESKSEELFDIDTAIAYIRCPQKKLNGNTNMRLSYI